MLAIFIVGLVAGIVVDRVLCNSDWASNEIKGLQDELARIRKINIELANKCKFVEGVDFIPLDGDCLKISDGVHEVTFGSDGKISQIVNIGGDK